MPDPRRNRKDEGVSGPADPSSAKSHGDSSAGKGDGESLKQRVLVLLRTYIRQGQLQPGERLLEAQVAKAFGISRSPVRGALGDLQQEGVIEPAQGRGYRVVGEAKPGVEGRIATFGPVRISVPRQWERMYAEVEKQISIQVLYGSVKISDQEMADHFGVSRTVSRDVLSRMHGVGMISQDKAGHWVAERTTPERIHQLFELRTILEPVALIKAAPLIPPHELVLARNNIDAALAQDPIESGAFDRTEADLHKGLLSYCPNQELLAALKQAHAVFAPTRYLDDPFLGIPMNLIAAALEEHAGIVDALISGDVEGAAEMLRQHIQVAESRWLMRLSISSQLSRQECPPYLTHMVEADG